METAGTDPWVRFEEGTDAAKEAQRIYLRFGVGRSRMAEEG